MFLANLVTKNQDNANRREVERSFKRAREIAAEIVLGGSISSMNMNFQMKKDLLSEIWNKYTLNFFDDTLINAIDEALRKSKLYDDISESIHRPVPGCSRISTFYNQISMLGGGCNLQLEIDEAMRRDVYLKYMFDATGRELSECLSQTFADYVSCFRGNASRGPVSSRAFTTKQLPVLKLLIEKSADTALDLSVLWKYYIQEVVGYIGPEDQTDIIMYNYVLDDNIKVYVRDIIYAFILGMAVEIANQKNDLMNIASCLKSLLEVNARIYLVENAMNLYLRLYPDSDNQNIESVLDSGNAIRDKLDNDAEFKATLEGEALKLLQHRKIDLARYEQSVKHKFAPLTIVALQKSIRFDSLRIFDKSTIDDIIMRTSSVSKTPIFYGGAGLIFEKASYMKLPTRICPLNEIVQFSFEEASAWITKTFNLQAAKSTFIEKTIASLPETKRQAYTDMLSFLGAVPDNQVVDVDRHIYFQSLWPWNENTEVVIDELIYPNIAYYIAAAVECDWTVLSPYMFYLGLLDGNREMRLRGVYQGYYTSKQQVVDYMADKRGDVKDIMLPFNQILKKPSDYFYAVREKIITSYASQATNMLIQQNTIAEDAVRKLTSLSVPIQVGTIGDPETPLEVMMRKIVSRAIQEVVVNTSKRDNAANSALEQTGISGMISSFALMRNDSGYAKDKSINEIHQIAFERASKLLYSCSYLARGIEQSPRFARVISTDLVEYVSDTFYQTCSTLKNLFDRLLMRMESRLTLSIISQFWKTDSIPPSNRMNPTHEVLWGSPEVGFYNERALRIALASGYANYFFKSDPKLTKTDSELQEYTPIYEKVFQVDDVANDFENLLEKGSSANKEKLSDENWDDFVLSTMFGEVARRLQLLFRLTGFDVELEDVYSFIVMIPVNAESGFPASITYLKFCLTTTNTAFSARLLSILNIVLNSDKIQHYNAARREASEEELQRIEDEES